MRRRNLWTRGKNAVPPDMALERRTKRVIPGFRPVRSLLDAVGPSLLSAFDLASRYGIEGEICRPLNHMRQIPRLLTAPDRPCQFSVSIRWLIYSSENSFYLSYGKHWSRTLQSVKVAYIHACINFYPGRPKKLCFTTPSLAPMISTARLGVVKQSSFGLPGQYGRSVTRANEEVLFIQLKRLSPKKCSKI